MAADGHHQIDKFGSKYEYMERQERSCWGERRADQLAGGSDTLGRDLPRGRCLRVKSDKIGVAYSGRHSRRYFPQIVELLGAEFDLSVSQKQL